MPIMHTTDMSQYPATPAKPGLGEIALGVFILYIILVVVRHFSGTFVINLKEG